MSLGREHELHARRKGRNAGVGLLLGGLVLIIMALTFTKILSEDFTWPDGSTTGEIRSQAAGSDE